MGSFYRDFLGKSERMWREIAICVQASEIQGFFAFGSE